MKRLKRIGGFSRRQALLRGAGALLAAAVSHRAAAASSPVVVELFTSQGCNSCPPADAYLTELARQPGIVALAYHIDYWDQLGWRDPFSSPAATARQRNYARMLGLKTIYTPQMVVNGRYDVIGSDRPRVATAIAAGATTPAVAVALTAEGGALSAQIGAGTGEGRIWFVGYELRHETRVRAGENAGRTLINMNVVRTIDDLGAWTGAPVSFRRDALAPGAGAAVLVQSADGAMRGAAAVSVTG